MSEHRLVPAEILDQFPEINPSNYSHDDACALNAWGVELVLAAAPAPEQQVEQETVTDEVLIDFAGQEQFLLFCGEEEFLDIARSVLQRFAPPAAPDAIAKTEVNIDAAAKVVAESFDYPWDHMPEQGRETMRKHVRAVIEAAYREKQS